jgi:hypothetical protein
MAEIGEHGSAFFQTPANTNEIMRAAQVGRLYCSSSSLTVHVFDVLGDADSIHHFPPKLTKLPSDVGKIGAFRNDYGTICSLLVGVSCASSKLRGKGRSGDRRNKASKMAQSARRFLRSLQRGICQTL